MDTIPLSDKAPNLCININMLKLFCTLSDKCLSVKFFRRFSKNVKYVNLTKILFKSNLYSSVVQVRFV